MILLDISIISELLRNTPAPKVIEWMDAQPLETMYISATTMAELQLGMALVEDEDRRNKGLKTWNSVCHHSSSAGSYPLISPASALSGPWWPRPSSAGPH